MRGVRKNPVFLRPGTVDRFPDHVDEAVLGDRLLQEVEGARLPGLDRPRHRPAFAA